MSSETSSATFQASPTGRQHVLEHGDVRAVVVEVGGGLRELSVRGTPVLAGYGELEPVTAARGQLLVPWPNRIQDGTYTWDGQEQQLALTEPEQSNALHGLLRYVPWDVVERDERSLTMGTTIWPQTGYPFLLQVRARYELTEDGVTVTTSATNLGGQAAPYGSGAHPYVTVGTDLIDDAVVHVPAAKWLPTGEQQAPTGVADVDGTPYDLRTPQRLGDREIDNAYVDLERDQSGRTVVTVAHPDGGRTVEFWVDDKHDWIEVFTGDSLPDQSERRRSLGLEPMTCPPNAFRDGTGVVRLEPGASHSSTWGLRLLDG
ncbi:MAG: aldose 1-epimerase family protein [Motilibacteraceae bacterium]